MINTNKICDTKSAFECQALKIFLMSSFLLPKQ